MKPLQFIRQMIGGDIVNALAAGTTSAMVGRAYLYALGAAVERGVDCLLGWFADDVRWTTTLIGAGPINGLDRSVLDFRGIS